MYELFSLRLVVSFSQPLSAAPARFKPGVFFFLFPECGVRTKPFDKFFLGISATASGTRLYPTVCLES